MSKIAVLVDGGFFRKRASFFWGKDATPKERADQLEKYCQLHVGDRDNGVPRELYRCFYYDCPPINKKVFNPLRGKDVDLGASGIYEWTHEFFEEIKHRRKFALRLGEISEASVEFRLTKKATNALLSKTRTVDEIKYRDLEYKATQKGVDMKIGIDIASMVFKKQVNQIVLISGDSDFVPAAKMARREGADFILDSMGSGILDNLFEHIDGLKSHYKDLQKHLKQQDTSESE